ncbi:MAG TPA: PQQ-dependent sugar dehydrogenase [Acidobacteriaceae bacterium]
MKVHVRTLSRPLAISAAAIVLTLSTLLAQESTFHNAPASTKQLKNPYEGQPAAGGPLYQSSCANCHGASRQGSGNIPSLNGDKFKSVTSGELFWFITKGDVDNGMPSWASLPEQQRWQIVSYLKSGLAPSAQVSASPAPAESASTPTAPPPTAPFVDYRFEKPGEIHKVTLKDLPDPYATDSAANAPKVVARPEGAWPKVPAGFEVGLYAAGLEEPREIRTAPNGDLFVSESEIGEIRVFRGMTKTGKPELEAVFATGLNRPFGINFYPAGPNPQWVYVGNTNAVVRFPYHNGDLQARGPAQHIMDLPGGKGHWTRDIQFSKDGKTMLVGVGSASNVDDPDTTPAEKNRADVLAANPDGSDMRIYAYGIRNPVGLAVNPQTGELWVSVNERDGLGDNLVPDYITHVQEGGYYGWPLWYMGGHQDPRHAGRHPELKEKVITPDVILQPHNASLELTFYNGKQFPSEYDGDIFAAEHGSWNKSIRAGYELIRVPLHQTGHASGEYEDFLTGFVVDNGHVWGRPVGVAVAPDGSLLVTDDGSNSIWRISYSGK